MKTIAIIAAAAAAFTTAAFATAASAAEPVGAIRVSYADLNLATPAGQAALARRIHAAANEVCGANRNDTDLAIKSHVAACRKQALAGADLAVARVSAPVLASR